MQPKIVFVDGRYWIATVAQDRMELIRLYNGPTPKNVIQVDTKNQ